MEIKLERLPNGYRVYRSVFLLAVITTKQHTDLNRGGVIVWEALPPENWSIHWTSPAMSLEDLKAVAAVLPTEA